MRLKPNIITPTSFKLVNCGERQAFIINDINPARDIIAPNKCENPLKGSLKYFFITPLLEIYYKN